MIRDLDYLVLSDVHLGHKRTKTSDIIDHLNKFFDNFSSRTDYITLDLIFIAGDLFDSLLDFSSSDIHEATLWLSRLIEFCGRHDIKLRVLEGTPSHDWKQSKIIDTIRDMLECKTDVRYIDTLYIEHIEDIDLTVLYVPDEWTASTELTYSQLQELLKEQSLSFVDIAIMHGVFGYQVQGIPVKIESHDESKYLSIVKHYINIGHYHNYSTYDRIIAQGSFDRLSHGEEEPKGAVRVHIGEENYFSFISNPHAKIYKTVVVRYKDVDKAMRSLDKQLKDIPTDSYVRIRCTKDHPIYSNLDNIKKRYPLLNFSKVAEETIAEAEKNVIEDDIDYVAIAITPDNICKLLKDEVTSNNTYSEIDESNLTKILGDTYEQLR